MFQKNYLFKYSIHSCAHKKSNDYLTGNLLQHIETQVDECKKIENKKQKIARNKECENQNQ